MIPIGAIGGVVSGLTGIAGGMIGSGKRKREQKAAQAEFNRNKARMEGADTSNLAKNMENTMEDLTVNTQAAEFQAQQQASGFANTMDNLSGAAGGSGIAALAQSLAGAQSNAAMQSSADIGRQEASNQALNVKWQVNYNNKNYKENTLLEQRKKIKWIQCLACLNKD